MKDDEVSFGCYILGVSKKLSFFFIAFLKKEERKKERNIGERVPCWI